MNLFNGKSNESWVSVEEIQKATGCDIGPLIVGLSQSAAKTPDNKYVVRVGDLKDYLALVGEVVKSLSEKKEKTEKPEKIDTTGWLSGRKFAEAAKVPIGVVNELIASGKLRAKNWARGYLVDPKELESMPMLLGRTVPEPDKGKGSDPPPPGGETGISGQAGKDEKTLPQGSEGGLNPDSGSDQNHQKDLEGSTPSGSDQNVDKGVGKGSDPNQKAGAGDTQTAGAVPGKNTAPGSGDPLKKPVCIKVKIDGSCDPGDVAIATGVSVFTVQKWAKDGAVKTDANGNINTESLKDFLIKQGRATSITWEKKKGMPSI
ncbi:MAG: hypothetical protein PHO90_00485 [Candidatus Pacebacteria bacterium]|nr:hypothetical protein [Candidatus Paceibacterota bacterium]